MENATKPPMVLSGDSNVPAMPMTEAEVNHLRRVLAWMRCEYTLDENMLAGCLDAATKMVEGGSITPERGQQLLEERAAHVNRVPAYIRQGVKMLTKALREHEKRSGVVEAEPSFFAPTNVPIKPAIESLESDAPLAGGFCDPSDKGCESCQ